MSTEIGQAAYIHGGNIAASKGATHALRGFRIPMTASKTTRRLYACFIVDECTDYNIEGELSFRLNEAPTLTIPVQVRYSSLGWGQNNAVLNGFQVGALPTWSATRTNDANAMTLGAVPVGVGLLHWGFSYTDSAPTTWTYHVHMAPLAVNVRASELVWTPSDFYGTQTQPTVLCAIAAVVLSDS